MKILINWKQKAGLMALGSIFTIIGMLLSPISAQKDTFREIQCEKLTVGYDKREFVSISKYGILMFRISPKQNFQQTTINASSAVFDNSELGDVIEIKDGTVTLKGIQDNKLVEIGTDEHGNGAVFTYHKNGNLQQ